MTPLTAGLITAAWLSTAVAQTETPAASPPSSVAEANAAAERAARAAEEAAKAAQRMADSSDRIAAALERLPAAATPGAVATTGGVPVPPPSAAQLWTGSVGANLISLSGNSSTLTGSVNATAERKTEDWIYSGKASGTYGHSQAAASEETEVTALNALVQFRGDRRFSPLLSAYLLAGGETDHVKSVEFRGYGEGGMGLIWIEHMEAAGFERAFLRTDLAVRGGQEYRFQYYPSALDLADIPIAAPRFGLTFRYAINDGVRFIEEAEVLPNLIGNRSVFVSSTTKLTARVAGPFSIGVGFKVDFNSEPAPGKQPTDTALTVGVEVAL